MRCRAYSSRSDLNPPVSSEEGRTRGTAGPRGGRELPVPPTPSKANTKIQISNPNDGAKAPAASAGTAAWPLPWDFSVGRRGGRSGSLPAAWLPSAARLSGGLLGTPQQLAGGADGPSNVPRTSNSTTFCSINERPGTC